MAKLWFIMCAIVLAIVGCRPADPALTIDRPGHDFPRDHTGPLVTQFVLRNTGGQTLEIRDLESDCGCTVAQLPNRLLEPGEQTIMQIHMDRPVIGNRAVTVTAKTNSPSTPAVHLQITAWAERNEARIAAWSRRS